MSVSLPLSTPFHVFVFSLHSPFPFSFHISSFPLLFFLLFPFAFSLAVSPRVSPSLTGDRSAPPLTLRHPSHTSEASLTWLEKWLGGDGWKLQSGCCPPLTFRYYQDVLHSNRCTVQHCLVIILIPFSLSTSKTFFLFFSLSPSVIPSVDPPHFTLPHPLSKHRNRTTEPTASPYGCLITDHLWPSLPSALL